MKKKPSIVTILITLCLLPALVSILVNLISSSGYMRSTAENEIEGTLKATGYTLLETFTTIDAGSYWLSGNLLYKGGTNLSDSLGIVDLSRKRPTSTVPSSTVTHAI